MGEHLNRAIELRPVVEQAMATGDISDDAILNAKSLLPGFNSDCYSYKTGQKFLFNGKVYKVLQDHTSQASWTPVSAQSLYAEVLTSETGEPLPWVQPDSTNPYMRGDRVIFEGKVYESLIDNNIWSPTAYPTGWKLV